MNQESDNFQQSSGEHKVQNDKSPKQTDNRGLGLRNRILQWDQLISSREHRQSLHTRCGDDNLPADSNGSKFRISNPLGIIKRILYTLFKLSYDLAKVAVSELMKIRRRFEK